MSIRNIGLHHGTFLPTDLPVSAFGTNRQKKVSSNLVKQNSGLLHQANVATAFLDRSRAIFGRARPLVGEEKGAVPSGKLVRIGGAVDVFVDAVADLHYTEAGYQKRRVMVPSWLFMAVVWVSGVIIIVLASVLASADIMWTLIGIVLWSWVVSYSYSKLSKRK